MNEPQWDKGELHGWWLDRADQEITPMIDKMIEYGGRGRAVDLVEIGRDIALLIGRREISDAEAVEIGVYFYVRGKMGRWFAAISEGRPVSDDTLYDISIYVRIVQRAREFGGWPI